MVSMGKIDEYEVVREFGSHHKVGDVIRVSQGVTQKAYLHRVDQGIRHTNGVMEFTAIPKVANLQDPTYFTFRGTIQKVAVG